MLREHPGVLIAGLALLAPLALPALALATDEAPSEILITDPALLESLGFPPDATDVYATPQALQQLLMGPAERERQQEELLSRLEAVPLGGPYGPSGGATTVSYHALQPTFSSSAYISTFVYQGSRLRCSNGDPAYEAQLTPLPHGALLAGAQLHLYDASSAWDISAALRRTCQVGNGPVVNTLLSFTSTDGSAGNQLRVLGGDGARVDNTFCYYWLWVRFGSDFDCPNDQDLGFRKAMVVWFRDVSPPPATATFEDVPASHPYFQYIEAVAASEIAPDCQPDKFCPGSVVTRGELAAFLARVLGLHWGAVP